MSYFYMSFCDPDRPAGQKFLGATIVEESDICAAITKSHMLGINPGGEIAFCELDFGEPEVMPPQALVYLHKFVTREEVMAQHFEPMFGRDGEATP